MKSFIGKKLVEFSCARKETVDIESLVTSRTCDRKIMQSIRMTSRVVATDQTPDRV